MTNKLPVPGTQVNSWWQPLERVPRHSYGAAHQGNKRGAAEQPARRLLTMPTSQRQPTYQMDLLACAPSYQALPVRVTAGLSTEENGP
jgi:hypothetical protein